MKRSQRWVAVKGWFGIALIVLAVFLFAPFINQVGQGVAWATRLAYDNLNESIQALGLSTVQTISYTGTSAATSNAVGSTVTTIRIVCETDVRIVIAASPTATTSHSKLPANTVEYFKVVAGLSKVAAIRDTASGDCTVTEMW